MSKSRCDDRVGHCAAARRCTSALLGLLFLFTLLPASVYAAPDRLGDVVPDAVPDLEGTWSVSWGYEAIDLEGPLAASTSASNYYKLRYQLNPTVHAGLLYRSHALDGGPGLLSPMLEGADSASAYGLDLGINLLNTPARPSFLDAEGNVIAWEPGSAFGVGVTLEKLSISLDDLSRDDTLMRAYLVYSTDLSEKLRAHTHFSTGRVAGDTHTGSWNRVAAGLDYELSDGPRPLTLLANAALDIHNFRRPTFDTSRISRFDVGLRYGISDNVFASAGWSTLNDSQSDSSGSGIFAGLQYVSDPRCVVDETFEEAAAFEEVPVPEVEQIPPPADVPEATPPPAPEPAAETAPEPEPVAEPEPADEPELTPAPEPEVLEVPGRADAGARMAAAADPPLMRVEPRPETRALATYETGTEPEPGVTHGVGAVPVPASDAEPEEPVVAQVEFDYGTPEDAWVDDESSLAAPPAALQAEDRVLRAPVGGVRIPKLTFEDWGKTELYAEQPAAQEAETADAPAESDEAAELNDAAEERSVSSAEPAEDDADVVSVTTVPAEQAPVD